MLAMKPLEGIPNAKAKQRDIKKGHLVSMMFIVLLARPSMRKAMLHDENKVGREDKVNVVNGVDCVNKLA